MTTIERSRAGTGQVDSAPTVVVEPVSHAPAARGGMAPALTIRPHLRIALVSNGKVNGTELLDAVARELDGLLPDATFTRYRKPSVSVPPDPEDFAEIVRTADAAICAIGDCGSCSSRTARDAIEFEWEGIPAVGIIADALFSPVDFMRRTSGMPDYPYCATPFPVGNLTPAETDRRGAVIAPQVLELLTTGRPEPTDVTPSATESIEAVVGPTAGLRRTFTDADEGVEAFFDLGWTDGLPVTLPTEARVEEMVAAVGGNPSDVVFGVPTRNGLTVTLELAAANAVMAGCRPEHFPVVLAALAALGSAESNAHGHTATMAGSQQVLIVNGPIRDRLGINSGEGALGPGTRANAVIGRAMRLVARNVMHSTHGRFDRAAFGHPGRWSWCFGEAEEQSPWTPLCGDRGFEPGSDTVTLYATSWQSSVICHSRDAEDLLDEIALAARTACHLNWLHGEVATESSFHEHRPFLWVTGHEHATVLLGGGYLDKRQIREALFTRLTEEHPTLRPVGIASADCIHLAYVHGTGMQQTWFFAPFQSHELVTRPIGAGSVEAADAPSATVDRALDGLRTSLAADDYHLDVAIAGKVVTIRVDAGPTACAECLVPDATIRGIVESALVEAGLASMVVEVRS